MKSNEFGCTEEYDCAKVEKITFKTTILGRNDIETKWIEKTACGKTIGQGGSVTRRDRGPKPTLLQKFTRSLKRFLIRITNPLVNWIHD